MTRSRGMTRPTRTRAAGMAPRRRQRAGSARAARLPPASSGAGATTGITTRTSGARPPAHEQGRPQGGRERWKPMYRNIDVMTEMRKLTDSKPVHVVAGAGALASQMLKDLPGRLVRWGTEDPVTSLPSRATGYAQTAQARANGYAQTAQARANGHV